MRRPRRIWGSPGMDTSHGFPNWHYCRHCHYFHCHHNQLHPFTSLIPECCEDANDEWRDGEEEGESVKEGSKESRQLQWARWAQL